MQPKTKLTTHITTGISRFIPTGTTDNNCYKYENDLLFEQLPDLVNSNFRSWYCKIFYNLGRNKVLELASIARSDGKNPPRLFSLLIKKENLRLINKHN